MTETENNPYAPYPKWFEKYGSPDKLEKYPHGEYLRKSIITNIKWYKENVKTKETRLCSNCGGTYITLKKSRKPCPFCKAPYKYDMKRVVRWFKK